MADHAVRPEGGVRADGDSNMHGCTSSSPKGQTHSHANRTSSILSSTSTDPYVGPLNTPDDTPQSKLSTPGSGFATKLTRPPVLASALMSDLNPESPEPAPSASRSGAMVASSPKATPSLSVSRSTSRQARHSTSRQGSSPFHNRITSQPTLFAIITPKGSKPLGTTLANANQKGGDDHKNAHHNQNEGDSILRSMVRENRTFSERTDHDNKKALKRFQNQNDGMTEPYHHRPQSETYSMSEIVLKSKSRSIIFEPPILPLINTELHPNPLPSPLNYTCEASASLDLDRHGSNEHDHDPDQDDGQRNPPPTPIVQDMPFHDFLPPRSNTNSLNSRPPRKIIPPPSNPNPNPIPMTTPMPIIPTLAELKLHPWNRASARLRLSMSSTSRSEPPRPFSHSPESKNPKPPPVTPQSSTNHLNLSPKSRGGFGGGFGVGFAATGGQFGFGTQGPGPLQKRHSVSRLSVSKVNNNNTPSRLKMYSSDSSLNTKGLQSPPPNSATSLEAMITSDKDYKCLYKASPLESTHNEYQPPLATRKGMLKKRSPKLLKTWQTRFFYLFKDQLFYFKESAHIPSGCIELRRVIEITSGTIKNSSVGSCEFSIRVKGGRKFEIKAETSHERKVWVRDIRLNWNVIKMQSHNLAHGLDGVPHTAQGGTLQEEASDPWQTESKIEAKSGEAKSGKANHAKPMGAKAKGAKAKGAKAKAKGLKKGNRKTLTTHRSPPAPYTSPVSSDSTDKMSLLPGRHRTGDSDDLRSEGSAVDGQYWKTAFHQTSPVSNQNLPTIHWKDYVKIAHTGDLFLFETSGIRGSLVRTATRSRFDHIAIALKFDNRGSKESLGVLEALGNHGVRIHSFMGFVRGWHKQYNTVAVRRLILPATAVDYNIQDFVREAVGKRYKWTVGMHFRRQSKIVNDCKKKTFFCSELVAKAYKEMNILREDVPSSAYLPGSFEESSGLVLFSGASLEPENRLTFD